MTPMQHKQDALKAVSVRLTAAQWQWLGAQGNASHRLRAIIEEARKQESDDRHKGKAPGDKSGGREVDVD